MFKAKSRSLMQRLLFSFLAAISLHAPARADATHADLSPATVKLANGKMNEVMVLGTPHLSHLPKAFEPAQLSLLMARLADWKPQVIAIEALSGLQCAWMRSFPQRYADAVEQYCSDTSVARAATGLDVIGATVEVEQLLSAWPATPTPAQRRALAARFMAAGEPASAMVQWLRLPLEERHAGDGLNGELVQAINALQTVRTEDYQIAAPLAAKSGLERVYSMDDHTSVPIGYGKEWGAAVSTAWDNPSTAKIKQTAAALQNHLDTPAGVLAMYRAYNERSRAELVFDSDFGAALEEPSPQHFGRSYVADWETRNLRMASNIREVIPPFGIRALVIVGASHKAYLQTYLNQMHDVRIISADTILR
jgi:hypothetical protein